MQLLDNSLVETRWSVALFLLHTVSSPFLAGIPFVQVGWNPQCTTIVLDRDACALIDSVV